jgi:type IV pilus assembly protein PilB
MPVKLGELLLKEKMITPQQLQEALNRQKISGGKLSKAFVSLGVLRAEEITSLLSRQYGVPSIDLGHFEVDPAIIRILPAETARKYQILPLSRSGATLTVAMADPTNVFAMDDVKFMTGYNVEPVVAFESALEDAIDHYYGSTRSVGMRRDAAAVGRFGTPGVGPTLRDFVETSTLSEDDMAAIGGLSEIDFDSMCAADADVETAKPEDDEIDLGNLSKSADAAPVIKLTNVMFVDALKRGASDIHIEPYEKEFRVRFRIDGVLYNVMALPMKLRDPLISRVKVMAKLNIAEKRLPQDGRFKIRMKVEDRSRDLDFRVSVRPTVWGETIVLRLVDRSKLILDMKRLGLEQRSLERFRSALSRSYGIVLVTGPQGSGKTNTLYSAIAALNRPETNVVTAEDPVEFDLPGINQVQINKAIGESAATVLRSLHNVDADVILVSEIQDSETARLAVSLAQQGHLVLSTLPTSDAPSAVTHLLSLGIDPYLAATAVNLIVAQRLVRRVCSKCKARLTGDVPSKTLIGVGFSHDEIGSFDVLEGRGCHACHGTGYKGRVGLYEVMEITPGIRDLIMAGATAVEIQRRAVEEGMLTLRMSGLEKIKIGLTTVEEVLRETVLYRSGGMPEMLPRGTGAEEGGGRPPADRTPARDRRRVGRGDPRPGPSGERAEEPHVAPRQCVALEPGGHAPLREAETVISDDSPDVLAGQLGKAKAEIDTLRQRLLELNGSEILVVQLANAKAEIDMLRQRLFELNSYRIAYERLLAEQSRPPMANH